MDKTDREGFLTLLERAILVQPAKNPDLALAAAVAGNIKMTQPAFLDAERKFFFDATQLRKLLVSPAVRNS